MSVDMRPVAPARASAKPGAPQPRKQGLLTRGKKPDGGAPPPMRVVTSPLLGTIIGWFPTIARAFRVTAVQPGHGATLPAVNLLPSVMMLEVKRRRTSRAFTVAGAGIVLAFGGVWALQNSSIAIASINLESTQSLVQGSLQRADALSPVGEYFQTLQGRLDLGATAYMEQADYSTILNQVNSAVPVGVSLTGVTIQFVPVSSLEAPTCGQETSPFENAGIRPLGCVTFDGTAASNEALSQFIRALNAVPGLLVPFAAPSQQAINGQVPFTGTAGISPSMNLSDTASTLIDVSGVEGLNPGLTAAVEGQQEGVTQ